MYPFEILEHHYLQHYVQILLDILFIKIWTVILISVPARTFGDDSLSGQLYMAEKCSKQWDGACELVSRNTDTTRVNVAKVDSPAFPQIKSEQCL